MKTLFTTAFFSLVFIISSFGQRTCATTEYHQHLDELHPEFAIQRELIETFTQNFIANENTADRSIITIPVVVHVLWKNAADNISTTQIQSQIDVLNEAFRLLNADFANAPAPFQAVAGDTEIEFCLASVDPLGNPTSGITRTQTTKDYFSAYTDDAKFTSTGGHDAWPRDSYLNIWVCHIDDGILGYAQFPGGPAATDGVVIETEAFGTIGNLEPNYSLGKTTVHEVGHWLNLWHIWGDVTGCGGTDYVDDTPNAYDKNFGCVSYPHVTCTNGPDGDMFVNYMDYSDDACLFMFTEGQGTRMRATFGSGGPREALLSSLGCGIALACGTPANLSVSGVTSGGATLSWDSVSGASSYEYVVSTSDATPGGTGTSTGSTTINVSSLTPGTYYYAFVRGNCGVDGYSMWAGPIGFFVPCNAVTSFPFTETFENSSSSRDCWLVDDYVNSIAAQYELGWEYYTGAGGGGSITSAHGGSLNAGFFVPGFVNAQTRLVSPTFNLSSFTGGAELNFWYGNQPWEGDVDTLRVYYRTSPSGSWTLIPGAEYYSGKSSWTEVTIDLPNISSAYSLAFKGSTNYGRGIVLDDVKISGTQSCVTPSGLSASASSAVTASISWNAEGSATGGYQYVVSTSNTTPGGSGTPTTNTSVSVSSLTPSTQYYVFVRSNCGGGEFSAWSASVSFITPPTNDDCVTAIELTPSLSCVPVSGNTVGGTQSLPAISCGGFTGNANDDVWYKFTAVSPNHTVTVNGIAFFDAVVDVRSGSCSGTNIACADAGVNGAIENVTLNGLTENAVYYVRVYEWGGSGDGDFTICVTMPAAPTWYLDADNDGYYVNTQVAYFSPGSGWNTTDGVSGDCDDNDPLVWQSGTLYIDSDGDGYDNGTQTVCYGASVPSGYSSTTSGSDCDDNDATAWQSALLYIDNDGDGYDNGTQTVCYGSSVPTGYSTTTSGSDCDDNDASVWQSATLYIDSDGDGYDNGTQTVCYGASVPSGYSSTTLDSDCDDNDATAWQSALLYIDSDGDGYDNGTQTVCYGSSVPAGYSATTSGSDCDDNDATAWQSASLYIDNDGDGYDNGTQTVCYGASIPSGYSSTILGSDCDDNDDSVWQSTTLYVDNDGDGYHGSTEVVCYGASIPSGYSDSTLGFDCNDSDSSIHPGAVELCDGVDNNCNGETDEGVVFQTYYEDNDGDGYGSSVSLGEFCSPPANSSLNSSDCDDNDATAWQSASLYIDNDGDGYDNGTQTVCYGASIPTGYSTTTLGSDCDDNDDSAWQSATLYVDNDGDGYHGSTAVVCYGASMPDGYSDSTLGFDCDDNDSSIHPGAAELCDGIDNNCNGETDEGVVFQTYYEDNDGDGYGSSVSLGEFCSPPTNSSLNNTDCDDNDSSVWQSATLYIDNDGDGYDNGTQTVCYGNSIPAGYSETTLGSDCDDNDDSVWQSATLYVDNDGDGYHGSTEVVCYGASMPDGYSDSTLGFDCDDNDNSVHPGAVELCDGIDNNCNGETDEGVVFQTYYEDNDGDGYGSSVSLGEFCSPPANSSLNSSDCDDNDASVWQSATLYIDNDGDGYDNGTQTVCYGNSIPAGYSATTLGSDCDDNDDSVWQSATLYVDNDGDGYHGSTEVVCYGASIPDGHSDSTLGFDCDDNDNSVHPGATELCDGIDNNCNGETDEGVVFQTYYEDNDGDGYGSSVSLGEFCSPPANSSLNNTDCDDNDASVWQSATLYVDNDGDGYHGSSAVVCYGASIPTGYTATTLGSDCDDSNSSIHPGATELCDGVDNNCNGQTDEGCGETYPVPINDQPAWNTPNVNVALGVYPSCIQYSGTLLGSTPSMPDGLNDVWYRMTAISNGVSVMVTSSMVDLKIEIYGGSAPVPSLVLLDSEDMNPFAGGTEILNFGGLTEGNNYFIRIASKSALGSGNDGAFKICARKLRRPICDKTGGMDNCAQFKSKPTGANSITFNFTNEENETYSVSSTTSYVMLSNPALHLRHEQTYEVTMTAKYVINDGAGNPEIIYVDSPGACEITINPHTTIAVRSNQRCENLAVLTRGSGANTYMGYQMDPNGPYICNSTGFRVEFTPVSNCNGDNPQVLDRFEKTILAPNTMISLNYAFAELPLQQYPYIGYWSVRWKPRFDGYYGNYGPAYVIAVNGTSALNMGMSLESDEMYGLNNSEGEIALSLYPNPNNGDLVNLNATGFASSEVNLRVLDGMGRVVYSNQYDVEGSLNTIVNFTEPLSSGLYLVELTSGDQIITRKMMIAK